MDIHGPGKPVEGKKVSEIPFTLILRLSLSNRLLNLYFVKTDLIKN